MYMRGVLHMVPTVKDNKGYIARLAEVFLDANIKKK